MTIAKTRAKPPRGTLPAFTPVPRQRHRRKGWTPARQLAFIEALADLGSVRAAAHSVGVTPDSAYLLRRHPEAREFRKAWEAALDIGIKRIEDIAMDRALNGIEVPVYSYGKLVGTRRIYNDGLLMFMLRNRAPRRFAADNARGMNAVDRQVLARHKREWRKEWERERYEADVKEAQEDGDDLIETIQKMHHRWYCNLSPEARAAYRAFRAAEDKDRTGAWRHDSSEPLAVAEAEYQEFFGPGRDGRAQASKLVDMRAWEGAEDGDNPPSSPRA